MKIVNLFGVRAVIPVGNPTGVFSPEGDLVTWLQIIVSLSKNP
jgi:hypothetical protein